jgi:hypothetical protein
MLSSVHDDLRDAGLLARSMDWRKFREVRASTHRDKKLHVRAKREMAFRA